MDQPTIAQLLANFTSTLPALSKLLAAIMYVVGFAFIFRGVYGFRQYGELRTMMSVNAEMRGPLILLLVGAILVYYPTTISTTLETIYSSPNVLSYQINPNWSQESNQMIQDVGEILTFIGYISFFRGWLLITHLTGQGAPPGTLGKAILHIVGGILLVNIFATWSIIESTLGLGG